MESRGQMQGQKKDYKDNRTERRTSEMDEQRSEEEEISLKTKTANPRISEQ